MAKIWASPSGQTTAAVVTGSVQCNSSTRPGTIYDWQSDFESYDSGIVKTLLWDSKRALLATSIASTVGSLVFLLIVDYVPRVGTLIATFIVLAILFLVAGTSLIAVYEDEYHSVAIAFYALALLVFNLGPNTITFMLPAELFSTKYRGTCYGIAAASGKLGAIIIQIIGRVVGVSNPSRGKWPLIAMLLAFCLVMLLGAFSAWTCVPEVQHSPGTRLDGRGNPREGPDTVSLFAAKRRMPPRSLENIQKTPVPDDQKLGIRINVELLWKTIRDPLKKKESV
jgi:PHS family inorganic phosphate transporter-like MFS transporter